MRTTRVSGPTTNGVGGVFETLGAIQNQLEVLTELVSRLESVFGAGLPAGTKDGSTPVPTIPSNLLDIRDRQANLISRLEGVVAVL